MPASGPTRGSIGSVKLSVSLSESDVAVLDEQARLRGLGSRSAVLREAIRLLRQSGLEEEYAAAWEEWQQSGEAAVWDATAGDGLADASR